MAMGEGFWRDCRGCTPRVWEALRWVRDQCQHPSTRQRKAVPTDVCKGVSQRDDCLMPTRN